MNLAARNGYGRIRRPHGITATRTCVSPCILCLDDRCHGLTSYGFGGTTLAGRDHDEKLHDAVIDFLAAALDNEDILIASRGTQIDAGLAVAELGQLACGRLSPESVADGLGEKRVRGTGKDLDLPHVWQLG